MLFTWPIHGLQLNRYVYKGPPPHIYVVPSRCLPNRGVIPGTASCTWVVGFVHLLYLFGHMDWQSILFFGCCSQPWVHYLKLGFSSNLLLISYTGIGCVVHSKLFELDITSSPTKCFILFLFNARNENLCQTVYSLLSTNPVIVTSTRIKLIACRGLPDVSILCCLCIYKDGIKGGLMCLHNGTHDICPVLEDLPY